MTESPREHMPPAARRDDHDAPVDAGPLEHGPCLHGAVAVNLQNDDVGARRSKGEPHAHEPAVQIRRTHHGTVALHSTIVPPPPEVPCRIEATQVHVGTAVGSGRTVPGYQHVAVVQRHDPVPDVVRRSAERPGPDDGSVRGHANDIHIAGRVGMLRGGAGRNECAVVRLCAAKAAIASAATVVVPPSRVARVDCDMRTPGGRRNVRSGSRAGRAQPRGGGTLGGGPAAAPGEHPARRPIPSAPTRTDSLEAWRSTQSPRPPFAVEPSATSFPAGTSHLHRRWPRDRSRGPRHRGDVRTCPRGRSTAASRRRHCSGR